MNYCLHFCNWYLAVVCCRDNRKENNVVSVLKDKDVEGHKFEGIDEVLKVGETRDQDNNKSSFVVNIDPFLQRLGEEMVAEKKGKGKKTKEKVERVKVDKKEKGRRNGGKEVSEEEGVDRVD